MRKNIWHIFPHLMFYWIIGLLLIHTYFSNQESSVFAEIYVKKELVARVNLDQDRIFHVHQLSPKVTFKVENGAIRIIDNNCPKKLCVQMGSISKPYENIICVPNRILIVINSKKSGRIRAITG